MAMCVCVCVEVVRFYDFVAEKQNGNNKPIRTDVLMKIAHRMSR